MVLVAMGRLVVALFVAVNLFVLVVFARPEHHRSSTGAVG